ncbi:MAG: alkaline phosphatase family protein [Bryobacteraceae bacterium]
MRRLRSSSLTAVIFVASAFAQNSRLTSAEPHARRVVILKIDGLNGDLLYRTMGEVDPTTGKSRLPWFSHIFSENGTIFENFYTRGISLSAPSWSMLDTGRHTVIRGNVEYDRYTGRVYDYLNFFPFYLMNARKRQVDMPGVEVLDRTGISLLLDSFPYAERFQSFQLFQRGVRWQTLGAVLNLRLKSQLFLSPVEGVEPPSLDELLERRTETELKTRNEDPEVVYLDFYTGDADHQGHATNQSAALLDVLRGLDALAGRLWTDIQSGPLSRETLFVAVSDHGMNNRPDVFSQGFSLPDFFNSPAGGAHHVVTNRHQLSDFKIMGLDPLVQRVVTPSTASFYLSGEVSKYPTAWLDLDGNERAGVQLRNSDLNKAHILLIQLARKDLSPAVRQPAARYLRRIIDKHRAAWTRNAAELEEELAALKVESEGRKSNAPKNHRWTEGEKEHGEDKVAVRNNRELTWWERELSAYGGYIRHLRKLMNFQPDPARPFHGSIPDLIPEFQLGDNNTVSDLQHYVVGAGPSGLVTDAATGELDENKSFRFVDYFPLLAAQRVRNNPQASLPPNPIDFSALRLPTEAPSDAKQAYWLFADDDHQLLIFTDQQEQISIKTVSRLRADPSGAISWTDEPWRAGFPLHLFEDPALHVPSGTSLEEWLSGWHTEGEWLDATHRCRYSNAVIGITEEMSPVEENVPGRPGMNPVLLRYERRRRALVTPDFHVFAADGWNFNARNFNPGGNHGSFFRISTQSVWMMAGEGVPVRRIEKPYDSLNFASSILHWLDKPAPMPDRIVSLQ